MKAIMIPHTGEIITKDIDGYKDIMMIFDGCLECLPVGKDFVCYVDEEGIYKGLLLNQRATVIVQQMLRKLGRTLIPGDFIKGTAVFIGQKMEDEGMVECDLPDHVIQEYFVSKTKLVDNKGRILLGQQYAGKLVQVEENDNTIIIKFVEAVPTSKLLT